MGVQSTLGEMANRVISTMHELPELSHLPINELHSIPLGHLRKNATRLHAVCRYKRGLRKANISGPEDVRRIDLHPEVINENWDRYAAFLLYHEYLHALGFSSHNRTFRDMEALWPDLESQSMGKSFGVHLRSRLAKWMWQCPSCDMQHARTRRSNGRYRCRTCESVLIDVAAEENYSSSSVLSP